MRPVLSGFVLALASLVGAPAAMAADAVLTYQVRLGGFDVAQAEVAIDLPESAGDGPYRARSVVVADGLLGVFTSFTSASDAAGTFAGSMAEPEAFRTDSTWRGESRVAALTWTDAGPPLTEVTPPPAADEREPVPPHLTVGSLDPLSAVLQLVSAGPDGGAQPVTVFDGRRLYGLSVEDMTERPVAVQVYDGPGWRAEIRYRRLGGASRKWDSRAELTVDALLAPGDAVGLPVPVPVRIIVPMQSFGSLVVELVAARPGEA